MTAAKSQRRIFIFGLHNVLLLFGIVGLVAVLAFDRHQLRQFLHILRSAEWYFIGLIIALQLVSYVINGFYYRSILRLFGHDLPTRRLIEGALASNFANYILPSAGIAGAGFLSQVLSPEVPRGVGSLTQFMRYAFSTFATLIVMPLGIILILQSHNSSHGTAYVVRSSIACVIAIIIFVSFVVVLLRRKTSVIRFADWLAHRFGKWINENRRSRIDLFIDELYVGIYAMGRNRRRLAATAVWSIIYILIAITIFYLIFPSLGSHVAPGAAIMAYLLATIVSVFGGELISTGVFEVGMAATLVALGVPFALAASSTILYKFLNLVIGLPLGFYCYNKYLPRQG